MHLSLTFPNKHGHFVNAPHKCPLVRSWRRYALRQGDLWGSPSATYQVDGELRGKLLALARRKPRDWRAKKLAVTTKNRSGR